MVQAVMVPIAQSSNVQQRQSGKTTITAHRNRISSPVLPVCPNGPKVLTSLSSADRTDRGEDASSCLDLKPHLMLVDLGLMVPRQ